ncbi:bcl-2-interacting killer isoform X1 [Artibeus jamaicensis]|uniref:bcl-2-interacting killer isoform X1 n=1 Tax=Artibeus jamaicensis TaxID=9417 RepID=UPI00235AF547|nr:bcl-2-interacting killer isoform X1 [Artibeus jamaicensis]
MCVICLEASLESTWQGPAATWDWAWPVLVELTGLLRPGKQRTAKAGSVEERSSDPRLGKCVWENREARRPAQRHMNSRIQARRLGKKCHKWDPSPGTSFCAPSSRSTACRLWGFPTRPVSSTSARSPLDDNRGRSAWDTVFLRSHGVSAHSDIPHEMAMRLAFIGDELEVRWMPPRVAQMPWMAVYSLAFTYTQTGLRGVLRSFLGGFTNLRGNRRFWSFLTLRDRVSPSLGRKLSLLLLLALLLDWGVQVLQ